MTAWVAWKVTFRRFVRLKSYDAQTTIIVVPPGDLQALLKVLQSEYDGAVIDKAEVLGPALVGRMSGVAA